MHKLYEHELRLAERTTKWEMEAGLGEVSCMVPARIVRAMAKVIRDNNIQLPKVELEELEQTK